MVNKLIKYTLNKCAPHFPFSIQRRTLAVAAQSDTNKTVKSDEPKGKTVYIKKKVERGQKNNDEENVDHIMKFIEVAELAKRHKCDFSEEELIEHSRIGKEFQKKSIYKRQMLEKDLSNKIWLQQEAIRSMPESFRAAALGKYF
jgi:hypothetical protein